MNYYAEDKTRVVCMLKTDLVERLDEYAVKNSISRTSAVSILLSQALDSADFMTTFRNLKDNEELASAIKYAIKNVTLEEEVM